MVQERITENDISNYNTVIIKPQCFFLLHGAKVVKPGNRKTLVK